MKLLMYLAGFAAIAAVDFPKIIKQKQRRELTTYMAIFLLVLALAVFVSLDVNTPSPVKMIESFYRDVLHLSFKTS